VAERDREAHNQPGLIDKIFGRADAKRAASVRAIEEAKRSDQSHHEIALQEYHVQLAEWKMLQHIAAGVLSGLIGAYKEALEELNPFTDIKELGRGARIMFNEHDAEIDVALHGIDHLPKEVKTLLKNGTVSVRPATTSLINEMYRTHVCSCVLRTARELFAVLPLQKALIHGTSELLNPKTGHLEAGVIISVLVTRETCEDLNFEDVDPVHCMANFVHHMRFSKATGVTQVAKLAPETTQPDTAQLRLG
jgi:hypothetical protein